VTVYDRFAPKSLLEEGHIRRGFASLLLFVMLSNTQLLGWGPVGHMAVSYIAYQHLAQTTKSRVSALLKLNPDYANWVKQIPPDTAPKDRRMVIFMIASTWPDQIKGKTDYADDGTENGNRPDGATSSQNIGYTDHLRHKYWHFVDTPFTQDGSALGAVPSPNAETQITAFRSVLASTKPDELKSYDLVWLLHLVGDVHQPLHAATRVSSTDPDGDAGGNKVTLCAKPCKNVLHAFWDGLPGSGSNPVATATSLGKSLGTPDPVLAADTDTGTWTKESYDLARQKVYVPPIGAGDGPFTITTSYRTAARKLAKKRVALAGARLANVLNGELK
jgi:hypothetical protein